MNNIRDNRRKRKFLKELRTKALLFGTVGILAGSAGFSLKGCVDNNNNEKDFEIVSDEGYYDTRWFEGHTNTHNINEITTSDVKVVFIENDTLSDEFHRCIANNEDFILVVKPTDYTYAGIYKTIDFVKEIVKKFDINYPILYDISTLMKEDVLTANVKLAKAFCDKLQANGCYTGLYGNDSDMIKFAERFSKKINGSIDSYDKFITYYNDKMEYSGVYNMSQVLNNNGVITFKYDLKGAIDNNGLNNSDKFINDLEHVVRDGECLADISKIYNIKIVDLANYNNLAVDSVLNIGQKLVIPNIYEKRPEMIKGIDVNHHQGEVDFEKLKNEVDFVIVRACSFESGNADCTNVELDKQFLRNIQECERLNIPVGVYYYSYADNIEEARNEAKFIADLLKNYSLELPVYMDIECDKQLKMCKDGTMNELVIEAMTELEAAGYFAGIYCNKGQVGEVFVNKCKMLYSMWLTNGIAYNSEVSVTEFDPNSLTQNLGNLYPEGSVPIIQYSQYAKINGINGNTDLNYADANLIEMVSKYYTRVKHN